MCANCKAPDRTCGRVTPAPSQPALQTLIARPGDGSVGVRHVMCTPKCFRFRFQFKSLKGETDSNIKHSWICLWTLRSIDHAFKRRVCRGKMIFEIQISKVDLMSRPPRFSLVQTRAGCWLYVLVSLPADLGLLFTGSWWVGGATKGCHCVCFMSSFWDFFIGRWERIWRRTVMTLIQ
jgi:hypothetical protein